MHTFSVVVYRIAIWAFQFLIKLLAPFRQDAKKWIAGRKEQPFLEVEVLQKTIWFHVASLGEYEQGKPVMEALKLAYPNCQLAISFFSPSGYDIVSKKNKSDLIFYLPADTAENAKQFIQHIQPKIAVFVKYDFWYFFLKELQLQAIPTFLVAAVFRPQQIFFKPYGVLFREMIFCFNHIFTQDEHASSLLYSINYHQATTTGDTRIERVKAIAHSNETLPKIIDFKNKNQLIVFGSTWAEDDHLALAFIEQTFEKYQDLNYLIAPHQMDEQQIQRLIKKSKVKAIQFSKWDTIQDAGSFRLLIIDSIGMLSKIYRYADIAFIGGGFQRGIHNILEAAVYHIPVLFGPNYKNFKEAVDLVKCEAAIVLNNSESLIEFYEQWNKDLDLRWKIQNELKKYFASQSNSSEAIVQKVLSIVESKNDA